MRARLLVLALLLGVPLLLLGPVLLRQERFLPIVPVVLEPLASELPRSAELARTRTNWVQSDRLFPVLTDQLAMGQALRAGEAPLWTPDLGLGLPLAGGSIAGPLYPPNSLGLLFDPERVAGPLALLTLVLSGLGMWLFLGRIGLGRGPRVVAILGVQLGSWAVGNLYYPMKVDAALWVPFALWAVEGLARGRRGAGAALALSVALSFLAGFPTVAVFGVCLVAAYGLVRLTPLANWLSPSREADHDASIGGPPPVLPPLLAALLAGALGVGLALVQLLPTLEASAQSKRTTTAAADLVHQALPTRATLGLVLHDMVASPTDRTPPGQHAIPWWITPPEQFERAAIANQLEWNLFVGVGVVALALVGLVAGGRRARFPAFALLVVIGYACAWPPIRWAYWLPGLGVGAPGRVLSMAWFLWPWMAALGVQAVVDNTPTARRWLMLISLLFALLLGGWAVGFNPQSWAHDFEETMLARYDQPPQFNENRESIRQRIPPATQLAQAEHFRYSLRFAAVAAWALAAAALLILRLAHRYPRLLWAPLAAVLLAEGFLAASEHVTGVPDEAGPTFPLTPAIEAMVQAAGDGRVLRLDTSANGLEDAVNLARPNLPQAYGVGDLTPYTVFTPRHLIELFQRIDPARYGDTYLTFNATLRDPAHLGHPILDLLRATAILSRRSIAHPRLEPVFDGEGFHVYRRRGAFGPARMCRTVLAAPSDDALLLNLSTPVFDVATCALLAPEHTGVVLPPSDESWTPGEIEFKRPSAGSIEAHVQGTKGGLLVVHDQWYPGWEATLDGRKVEILRVDHAFRGVVMPPGDHLLRMEYRPASARNGLLLALFSLFGVALLARHPR